MNKIYIYKYISIYLFIYIIYKEKKVCYQKMAQFDPILGK